MTLTLLQWLYRTVGQTRLAVDYATASSHCLAGCTVAIKPTFSLRMFFTCFYAVQVNTSLWTLPFHWMLVDLASVGLLVGSRVTRNIGWIVGSVWHKILDSWFHCSQHWLFHSSCCASCWFRIALYCTSCWFHVVLYCTSCWFGFISYCTFSSNHSNMHRFSFPGFESPNQPGCASLGGHAAFLPSTPNAAEHLELSEPCREGFFSVAISDPTNKAGRDANTLFCMSKRHNVNAMQSVHGLGEMAASRSKHYQPSAENICDLVSGVKDHAAAAIRTADEMKQAVNDALMIATMVEEAFVLLDNCYHGTTFSNFSQLASVMEATTILQWLPPCHNDNALPSLICKALRINDFDDVLANESHDVLLCLLDYADQVDYVTLSSFKAYFDALRGYVHPSVSWNAAKIYRWVLCITISHEVILEILSLTLSLSVLMQGQDLHYWHVASPCWDLL